MATGKTGKFIVVEGIDGTGKSTLVAALREHLAGAAVTWVRDPGSTPVSAAIRRLLLDPANTAIAPRTELLLYCASRAQLLEEVVLPALRRGENVVSDRFYYSTLAYQGAHGLMPPDELRSLVVGAAGGASPDLVLLLDAPAEVCMARLDRAHDRVESRGVAYMAKVRELYLREVALLPPGRAQVLDATQKPEAIAAQAATAVDAALER
ncbi:MAG: dTMP kinase [Planctomycetes bacterium]|nr:dTMP kinase [Planctomycetota bacterium]